MKVLETCDAEDRLFQNYFTPYPKYLAYEYAQVLAKGTADFLKCFSTWLGIGNQFPAGARYKKQATLALTQTILNFDEVATALRGTRFEFCLTDEVLAAPVPSTSPPAALPPTRPRPRIRRHIQSQ